MTIIPAAILLLSLINGPSISGPKQNNSREIDNRIERQRNSIRPQERAGFADIHDMVESFYISRLQEELELSDSQFSRILKPVRESLKSRTRLSRERSLAVREVRKALRGKATEETIMKHIQAIDTANLKLRNVQQQLLKRIDPELTPNQRAHLRIIQMNLEQRIRNMIDRSRNRARSPIGGPPGK